MYSNLVTDQLIINLYKISTPQYIIAAIKNVQIGSCTSHVFDPGHDKKFKLVTLMTSELIIIYS